MALTDKQIKELSPTKLVVKIMEEAAELVQAGSKLLLHGELATATNPDGTNKHYDNLALFYQEYEQVRSLMIEQMDRSGNTYGVVVTTLARERNHDNRLPTR